MARSLVIVASVFAGLAIVCVVRRRRLAKSGFHAAAEDEGIVAALCAAVALVTALMAAGRFA